MKANTFYISPKPGRNCFATIVAIMAGIVVVRLRVNTVLWQTHVTFVQQEGPIHERQLDSNLVAMRCCMLRRFNGGIGGRRPTRQKRSRAEVPGIDNSTIRCWRP